MGAKTKSDIKKTQENKEKDAVRKAQADKDANQNKAEYDTKLGQGKKEEKAAAVNVLAKQKILKQTEADDAAEKSNAERAAKKDEKAQKTAVKQTKCQGKTRQA